MSDPIFKIKIEKRFDCYTKISKKNYIYYNLLLNFFSFKNPIAKNKIETFFSDFSPNTVMGYASILLG